MNGWTYDWMMDDDNEWICECMNGRINGWINGWIYEWIYEWMDLNIWIDEYMNECMNKWIFEKIGWIYEWMDEYLNEWMNIWMKEYVNDEWMNNECINTLWINKWILEGEAASDGHLPFLHQHEHDAAECGSWRAGLEDGAEQALRPRLPGGPRGRPTVSQSIYIKLEYSYGLENVKNRGAVLLLATKNIR